MIAPDHRPVRKAHRVRIGFLERQQALLERCLRGDAPADVAGNEAMLVDLLQPGRGPRDALETYLRQMIRVMDFDVRRRGRLVTAGELEQYTAWLAAAGQEA